jgi:hypothetical protein
MIANHVGANYPDKFGGYALGEAYGVSLTATGNAVATIAILGGTKYIIRQITVMNANATINTANITIITSNDGNATNAVSNNVVLANVTSTSTYQDLGLVAGTVTGTYTAGALFVKVNTAVTNGTCDITVFGDVVSL